MEGRKYRDENYDYRYGFNGKEDDKDFGDKQLIQDYGFRLYNPAIARFLSVDPLAPSYPWNSVYAFAEGSPIANTDLDGLEKKDNTIAEVIVGAAVSTSEGISATTVGSGGGMMNGGKPTDLSPKSGMWNGVRNFLARHSLKIARIGVFLAALLTPNNKVGVAHPETTQVFMMSMEGNFFRDLHRRRFIMKEGSEEWIYYQNLLRNGDERFDPNLAIEMLANDWNITIEEKNFGTKERIYFTQNNSTNPLLTLTIDLYGKVMEAYIKTDGTSAKGKGGKLFSYALDFYIERIGGLEEFSDYEFHAIWGESLPSNLNEFNKNLRDKMSPEDAARNTFTGREMGRRGLNTVTFEDPVDLNGNNKLVTPIFSK